MIYLLVEWPKHYVVKDDEEKSQNKNSNPNYISGLRITMLLANFWFCRFRINELISCISSLFLRDVTFNNIRFTYMSNSLLFSHLLWLLCGLYGCYSNIYLGMLDDNFLDSDCFLDYSSIKGFWDPFRELLIWVGEFKRLLSRFSVYC